MCDRDEQRVYYIGGTSSMFPINKCEYLDLAKNQWIRLPNTTEKHGDWPLVWKHPDHKDILLVASHRANTMESYDLRESWKLEATRQYDSGWSLVYGHSNRYPMHGASLMDVFHLQGNYGNYGRLLRFNDHQL